MDNQPKPIPSDVAACATCHFSRVVKVAPGSEQTVRVCRFGPPVPVVLMMPSQIRPDIASPTVMPSMHPNVLEHQWCFQYIRTENPAELLTDTAPKLLGSDGKSILNG